jgi:hypothetical protein
MRVARKGLEVADAVVAGPRAEGLLALERQCAKRRVTASAAAAADVDPAIEDEEPALLLRGTNSGRS